jgi:hypothetical protein
MNVRLIAALVALAAAAAAWLVVLEAIRQTV